MGYLTSAGSAVSKPKRRIFSVIICFFLAFSFLAGTMGEAIITAKNSSNIALAGDEEETMNEAADGVSRDQEGFQKALESASGAVPDNTSFSYVLYRLFSLTYINDTKDGVAAGDYKEKDRQCDVDDPMKGTPNYHNCDVPNIVTEFVQMLNSLLIPTGPQGAQAGQAKAFFGFGIPSTIPGNGSVPVNPYDRSVKYTGLELFGYNLKYTSYKGEWDNIKVMTEARTLSNFGVMDSLRLGVATIVNGIIGGVSTGVSNLLDGLSRGDLLGAIGGFFSGLFGGGAAAAVNTVLDTSDMNVFNTNAWYRVDYGSTIYGGRELNQTEIARNIQMRLKLYLEQRPLDKAGLPQDFNDIQTGPPKPKEAISKCTYTDSAGKEQEIKDTTNPPGGISEDDCKTLAKASPYNDETPTWSVDGNQKAELIKDWKVTHKAIFDTAAKYNIECTISDDEEGRQANLNQFYSCWTTAWNSVKGDVSQSAQGQVNQEWLNTAFGQMALSNFFSLPVNNWNAPWNRFVCTDQKGEDIIVNGFEKMFYKLDGSQNGCGELRPPIQNGYYGNGYLSDQKLPGVDTRWAALDHYSIFDVFVRPTVWFGTDGVANFGLNVATFFTQASNEVIDIAFSPILEKLGLDTKIVSIIEAFRDSLYFPFIAMLIALAGLTILFQAGKRKAYAAAFKDLALVIGTFMLGVIILFNPKGLITVVDKVPAEIETGIMGTIFNVGMEDDDGVCSASQTSGGGATDLEGRALTFSPRASIRTMECEIWRVFAFNPWVQGQWGTTYSNLYANNNAKAGGSTLKNSNISLVGDAPVMMGGGTTIHNWALYQLDATTVGTSTTEDLTGKAGNTSRDFYRLVDVQAGPNNGAASDGTYFESWRGAQPGTRTVIGLMAGFVSIMGFITIAAYSIVKIEITLLTAIMLLFAPIFLLLGVHPTFGRVRLKQYAGTIVALMIQRIILITLLAVMLKLLTAISLGTENYLLGGLLAAGTCIAFLAYRKEIFKLVTGSVSNATGGIFAQDAVDNVRGKFQEMLPMSARNKIGMTRTAVTNGAGGFVGGFVGGGMAGGLSAAKQSAMLGQNRLRNKQKRTGVGAFTKFSEAREAGRREGMNATEEREKNIDLTTGRLRREAVVSRLNKEFSERRAADFRERGLADKLNDDDKWMKWDPDSRLNRNTFDALVPVMSRISELEKQNQDGVTPDLNPDDTPMVQMRKRKLARDLRQQELQELRQEASVLSDELYQRNASHEDYDYFKEATEKKRQEREAYLAENPDAVVEEEEERITREATLKKMDVVDRLNVETTRLKSRLDETLREFEQDATESKQARYNKMRKRQDAWRGE